MISNNNLRIAIPVAVLIVVGSVGATTLLLTMFMGPNSRESASVNSVPVRTEIQSTTVTDEPQYSLPVRLTIPKINVDSDIAYMGLTSSGDMEAPKTNQDSGWYEYGPRPGNTGSAVIAGHLGVDSPAVFTDLSLLVKGDTLSVTDDRGRVVSFIVTDARMYDYDTEPSEVFSSTSGARLNLITCNGEWDSELKAYPKRLVVFTDRIE